MNSETHYNESGTSPPSRTGFAPKFTAFSVPQLGIDSEKGQHTVIGWKLLKTGFAYVTDKNSTIPAEELKLYSNPMYPGPLDMQEHLEMLLGRLGVAK